jgi:hypothetical protein
VYFVWCAWLIVFLTGQVNEDAERIFQQLTNFFFETGSSWQFQYTRWVMTLDSPLYGVMKLLYDTSSKRKSLASLDPNDTC